MSVVQYDQNALSQPGHVWYHFNVFLFTEFIRGIFKALKLLHRLISILLLTALRCLKMHQLSSSRLAPHLTVSLLAKKDVKRSHTHSTSHSEPLEGEFQVLNSP